MKQFIICVLLLASLTSMAQKKSKLDPATAAINASKEATINALNASYDADKKTALQIWDFAEVGYKEVKS
jgi:aminobenzoyl-glutamate utilization protein B